MRSFPIAAGCLLAIAVALPAQADDKVYVTTLGGAAEVTPNNSPGTGTGRVTIDFDLLTMRVEASFADLVGTTTASHIHCCTAVAGTGPAGVATQTPTFVDFPLGVTSGTYDHTFDLSALATYNAPFVTANGGTAAGAFAALVAGLDGGQAYLNIHSSQFPGGEIRGFLQPVPEPATAVLTLGGLVLLAVARRRAGAG